MDYSPQAVHWIGAQMTQGKEFNWVDGSKMNFKVSRFGGAVNVFLKSTILTGMGSGTRSYREELQGARLSGAPVENVDNANAAIGSVLDSTPMQKVWWLRLQEKESQIRLDNRAQSHRHWGGGVSLLPRLSENVSAQQ